MEKMKRSKRFAQNPFWRQYTLYTARLDDDPHIIIKSISLSAANIVKLNFVQLFEIKRIFMIYIFLITHFESWNDLGCVVGRCWCSCLTWRRRRW